MKYEELTQASKLLTIEEQELLLNIGTATGEDGALVAMDMDIRNNLSQALGDLGKSVQLLIVLLEQNNIVNMLPEVALPHYSDIMESISEAATLGTQMVLKSHEFDNGTLFSAMPEQCYVIQ